MLTTWNSSYLFGYDNISGWGYRYFYTSYNEIGERHFFSLSLEVTLYILVFVISMFANLLVIVCILRYSEMRTVTNAFVLNLASADLVFVLTMPAVLTARITNGWILGEVACKVFPYQQCVSAVALLWTLSLISVDRHLCTVVPPYRSRFSVAQAHYLSAITWLAAALLVVPMLYWFRLQDVMDATEFLQIFGLEGELEIMKNSSIYVDPQELLPKHNELFESSTEVVTICALVFPKSGLIDYAKWSLIGVLTISGLPMGILVYNYQAIFRKVMASKNTWGSSCVSVSTASTAAGVRGSARPSLQSGRRHSEISISDILSPWPRKHSNSSQLGGAAGARLGSLSRHEELRANKHIKTARVLFINVVVVLAMWLPIMAVLLLIYLDGQRSNANHGFFVRAHHFTAALMVSYTNTIITPLLFCLFSDDFLNGIKRLFRNTFYTTTTTATTGRGGGASRDGGDEQTKNGPRTPASDMEGAMELYATTPSGGARSNKRPKERDKDKVAPVGHGATHNVPATAARGGTGARVVISNIVSVAESSTIRTHSSISE